MQVRRISHDLHVTMPLRRTVTVGMMMRTNAAGFVSAHVLHDLIAMAWNIGRILICHFRNDLKFHQGPPERFENLDLELEAATFSSEQVVHIHMSDSPLCSEYIMQGRHSHALAVSSARSSIAKWRARRAAKHKAYS